MTNKSELSKFSGNKTLVEVLHELKWLNEQGLYLDGASLAQEIFKLRSSFIRVLEELTGNREITRMPEKEKSARIRRFLSELEEAAEIEQENWEYQLNENKFRRINRRTQHLEDIEEEEEFMELSNKQSEIPDPPKPPEGFGRIEVIFRVEPSPTLKEALLRNHFTFKDNIAHGLSGDWIVKMADEIVLARGEVKLPKRKGQFDPWR